jgi:hypothetical protein
MRASSWMMGLKYSVATKETELEAAKTRVIDLYYDARAKGQNNLPQNTRSFSSVAKSIVNGLEEIACRISLRYTVLVGNIIILKQGISMRIASLLVLCTLFMSCASRPASITPVAVSATDYAGLSCGSTMVALTGKRTEVDELSRQQSRAATGDAIGVLFMLLPVGTIIGANVKGELALAKGEMNALERAVSLNCNSN